MRLFPLPTVWLTAMGFTAGLPATAEAPASVTVEACNSHEELADLLTRKYSEGPTAIGLQSNGYLLEVFVAQDGASWTIISTRPDGLSCILAAGEDWERLRDPIGEPVA